MPSSGFAVVISGHLLLCENRRGVATVIVLPLRFERTGVRVCLPAIVSLSFTVWRGVSPAAGGSGGCGWACPPGRRGRRRPCARREVDVTASAPCIRSLAARRRRTRRSEGKRLQRGKPLGTPGKTRARTREYRPRPRNTRARTRKYQVRTRREPPPADTKLPRKGPDNRTMPERLVASPNKLSGR